MDFNNNEYQEWLIKQKEINPKMCSILSSFELYTMFELEPKEKKPKEKQ